MSVSSCVPGIHIETAGPCPPGKNNRRVISAVAVVLCKVFERTTLWNPDAANEIGDNLKTFKEAIRTRNFAVTASLGLLPETDAGKICKQADCLRDHIDAVLLTDNQFGQMHMSTLASSALFLQNGVDPIMQLSCRNRNRTALLADLFGAGALGIGSLLLVRGKKVPKEIKPGPKPVLDMTVTDLISTAFKMNSDAQRGALPNFFIGASVSPHDPEAGWVPKKLARKIDAGSQFVQMPICMDVSLLRHYMKHLVASDLIHRVNVITGAAIFPSVDGAHWLRENRANARIPDVIFSRLEQAKDPEEEGIRICTEFLQEVAEIPGISGASITPGGNLEAIPAAVQAAKLNS